MKRIIHFLMLLAMVSAMAPAVLDAQSTNRARAQQTLQANLPDGVTAENATLDQLEAALEAIAGSLSAEDYAELSGELAFIMAEAQPQIAAETSSAVVSRASPARIAAVAVSVAANSSAASSGRPGASSATQIAQQVIAAAAPRGGVTTQAISQAIVNSVPAAAAEISQNMNVQVSVPATPIAPPSGSAPVAAPPAPAPAPVVMVPIPEPEQEDTPDFIDIPEDPEEPSPSAN